MQARSMRNGVLMTVWCLSCVVAISAQEPSEVEPRQGEISRLLEQAVQSSDPAEQVELYKEVLRLDPNNTNAFNGLQDARRQIEEEQKKTEQQHEEERRKAEEAKASAAAQEEAVQKADRAIASGDLAGAREALSQARRYGGTHPALQRMDSQIQALATYRQRVKYVIVGLVAALLAGLFALVWSMFRRKVPYLEIVEGLEKGRRFTLDKDVTLLGAVSKYGKDTNDIVLEDEDGLVSRCHCEVHRHDGKLYLIDSGSANGTFLDQKRLEPDKAVLLKRGSRIGLAGVCALRLGYEKRKKK